MHKNYEPDADHPLTMACPYFPSAERQHLAAEIESILTGRLSMGPRVQQFEDAFAAYCGVASAVAFPSCSTALEAALTSLGLERGAEVLVPAQTFIATGMAVHLAGGHPVFTEIDDGFGMDFDDAWSRVTGRTAGAIVVHFGGRIPRGLQAFVDRMRASGRFVIEDAAHATGSELDGKKAGSFGDVACFSFHSTKVITTGEGGMLVTSRGDVLRVARSLQHRGRDFDADVERYILPGRNNRFTEIAAAMGLSQLRCLPRFLEIRRSVGEIYDHLLRERFAADGLAAEHTNRSSYWRYVLLPKWQIDRPALRDALMADGIHVDWLYEPALHLQPVCRELFAMRPGMLPQAEQRMSRHVCLPVHARMRDVDAEYVAERFQLHASRAMQRAS